MEPRITPQIAWLTLTRACNFRCPWCYAQGAGFDPKKNMNLTLAMQIVKSCASIGVNLFILIGGEPTISKNLFQITEWIRSLSAKSNLVTNAQMFGNDQFWHSYQNCPNDGVSVSFKAWDEES